ncbi:MAG: hypothetical protein HQL94_04955 [Magnetococcales bacterium]|nr:hypothetical protein [Magnetococcales bacterium]MBF0439756.1 hypothetical protein [Magnetococcales bacterium]
MSRAKVQSLLKNTDLLLNAEDIHFVMDKVLHEKRGLELRVNRGKTLYSASLLQKKAGKSLLISLLKSEVGNQALEPGGLVATLFQMEGYVLESRLTCLKSPDKEGTRLSYPELFRVHSKRQVSRFTIPMEKACIVEMTTEQGCVHGELLDINQEGLSFHTDKGLWEIPENSAVRLRLIPETHPAMDLAGILRHAGRVICNGGDSSRNRYSVQVMDTANLEAFRQYLSEIKTSFLDLFRTSVMSEESYRMITAI